MAKPVVISEKPQGKGVTIYLPGEVMDMLDFLCELSEAKRSQLIAQLIRNHMEDTE